MRLRIGKLQIMAACIVMVFFLSPILLCIDTTISHIIGIMVFVTGMLTGAFTIFGTYRSVIRRLESRVAPPDPAPRSQHSRVIPGEFQLGVDPTASIRPVTQIHAPER